MEKTPEEAYIEGRLVGLNELISILKEATEGDKDVPTAALVKTIVGHISNEMNAILDDLKGTHPGHPAIREAQRTVKEDIAPPAKIKADEAPAVLKKNVQAADELMQSLLELKKQNAKEE